MCHFSKAKKGTHCPVEDALTTKKNLSRQKKFPRRRDFCPDADLPKRIRGNRMIKVQIEKLNFIKYFTGLGCQVALILHHSLQHVANDKQRSIFLLFCIFRSILVENSRFYNGLSHSGINTCNVLHFNLFLFLVKPIQFFGQSRGAILISLTFSLSRKMCFYILMEAVDFYRFEMDDSSSANVFTMFTRTQKIKIRTNFEYDFANWSEILFEPESSLTFDICFQWKIMAAEIR